MAKVTIGTEEVYLSPDKLPEFIYSLNELTDPSKIAGARSTTFDIPATNGARAALGGMTMAEEEVASLPFRIGDAGQTLFEGTCTPVEWDDDSIKINAFGDNAGWFAAAKSTKLQDLDLGQSDTIDETYQRESWTDLDQVDVYPLIDYGAFVDRDDQYNVTVQQLRPAVRTWAILRRFFADNGFTVKATGRLARHWKKFILPNNGKVKVSRQYMADMGATVYGADSAGGEIPQFYPVAPAQLPFPSGIYGTDDPTAHIVSGNVYQASRDVRIRVKVDGTITHDNTGSAGGRYRIVAYDYLTNKARSLGYWYNAFGPNQLVSINLDEQVIWEGDILSGEQIGVGIFACTPGFSAYQTHNIAVSFEVTNIPYEDGVTIDIAGGLPKMTVADLVSGMCNTLRLTARTDTSSHVVEFAYYDDYLDSESTGIDWTNEIDHRGLSKVQPPVPASFNFRFKEDKNDKYLREFREVRERGYGDYEYLTGGNDTPVEIEVPFAPTTEDVRFGNIAMPVLAKEGPYYRQDTYEWEPRILIMDGTTAGSWTHDGTYMTTAPRTYFVGSLPTDLSLAFGNETDSGTALRGTVDTYWANYLRRITSTFIRAKVRVYDDEFMGFTFDRPRLVHDGFHAHWCYVGMIKGKRFGDEGFVEVELIPM